ncbi:MAG: YbaN family protein [Pseudomonadota bacterium]
MALQDQSADDPSANRRGRVFWRWIGAGLFSLGLIGTVVPVLPTALFWILALLALQKSDPVLSNRIRGWPAIGQVVADFVDHGTIGPKAKFAAFMGMSLSAMLLAIVVGPGWILYAALFGIGLGAVYVLTRPSRPPH